MNRFTHTRRAAVAASALAFLFACALPLAAHAHGDPESEIDPNAMGSTQRHAQADGLLQSLRTERREWNAGLRISRRELRRWRARNRKRGLRVLSDQQLREGVLLSSLGVPLPVVKSAQVRGPQAALLSASATPATSDALCQSANAAQVGAWSCPVTPQYATSGPFTYNGVSYPGDPIKDTSKPYEFDSYHNYTSATYSSSANNNVRYWSPNPRIVPVFEAMLPNGKIIFWDWYFTGVMDDPDQTVKPGTRVLLWDPAHPELPGQRVDYYGANLFCAGYSQLPNGDLLLAGGNANAAMAGINQTFVYHWRTNTWERSQNMTRNRWYPAVTGLSNGESLILGGDPTDNDPASYYYEPGAPYPEVFTSRYKQDGAQTWDASNPGANQHLRSLTAVAGQIQSWRLYPQNYLSVDGRVLYAGSEPGMQLIDPRGTGSVTNHGNRDGVNRVYGSGVVYNTGKVLVGGGGQPSQYSFSVPSAQKSGANCLGYPWGDPRYGVGSPGNLVMLGDKSACIGNNTMTYANDHGATASATKIDLSGGATPGIPSAAATSAMANPRRFHYLTVLPTGSVLASGGLSTTDVSPIPSGQYAGQTLDGGNDNSNRALVNLDAPVYAAEMWNPQNGQWTTMAAGSVPRQYHSTAILLPDGRVLQGGGGVCGACIHYQYSEGNFQYYSPPYLFNANGTLRSATQRPRITGPFNTDGDNTQVLAPLDYNGSLTIDYAQADGGVALAKAALVKLGAPTHSVDMGQRYVPVGLQVNSATSATITGPDNSFEAPPGYYMLFLIDADGTPSVAKMVQVGARLALANVSSAVSVYANANLGGASEDLGLGKFSSSDGNLAQVGNDAIDSIVVQPGYKADICTESAFTNCTTLSSGTYNNLSSPWNNSISAIRVYDGPATPAISAGPAAGSTTQTTSAVFQFSSATAGVTYECHLDAAAYAACSSPFATGSLADGSHTFYVRAKNVAGTYSSEASRQWTIDSTAPAAPVLVRTAPAGSPTNSKSATLTATGVEAGAQLQFSANAGGSWSNSANPVSLSALADGAYSYVVRAVDQAGNASAPSNAVVWTVDTAPPGPPTVVRTSPTADPTASTTQTIAITPAEAGGTLACKLDGSPYPTCQTTPFVLNSLTTGQHTFSVIQTDAAGNAGSAAAVIWNVNADPVSAPTISSGPAAGSFVNSQAASFGFSSATFGVSYQCRVDGAAYSACSSPAPTGSLADGSHTFYVRAVNNVGTLSPETSRQWTIDTTAPASPAVVLTAPTSSPTQSKSATIGFSGEANATFYGKLGAAAPAVVTSPLSLGNLADGTYTYSVFQVDRAGNQSGAASVVWTVDTTAPAAPSLVRTAPATSPTTSTSATLTAGGVEAGAQLQYSSTGGASWTNASSPIALSGLADGTHSYTVRAVDAAGNAGAASSPVSWTVDTTPPPAPSVTGPSGTSALQSATIGFSDTEAGVSFECALDGGGAPAFAACTSPKNLSGLANGGHTFDVRAKDALGNTSGATRISWSVDTAAFTAQITGGPSGTVAATSAAFTYSATPAAGSTFECKLDGSPFAACPAAGTSYSALADGSHSFAVRATNSGQTSAQAVRSWVVDATPPNISAVGPGTTGASGSISFGVSDATTPVTVTCKLDSAAAAACSGAFAFAGLADGAHSLTITATDAVGNSGSAPISWSVDATAPDTSLSNAPASPTNSTSAAISFASSEPNSTLRCSVDGAAFSVCATPLTLAGLADGMHSVAVRATDQYGNTDPTPAGASWVVDTQAPGAPALARTSPSADPAASTSQYVLVTPAEPGGTLACKLDAATTANCAPGTIAFSGLGQGVHSFSVAQTDAAGNNGPPAQVSWAVDTISPVIEISAPSLDEQTADPFQPVIFSVTDAHAAASSSCAYDEAAGTPCVSSAAPASALTPGPHTVSVTHVDTAGNAATASVSFTVTGVGPTGPTGEPTGPTGEPTGPTSEPSGPTAGPTDPVTGQTGPTGSEKGSSTGSPKPIRPPELRIADRVPNARTIGFLVRCRSACGVTARFSIDGRTTHAVRIELAGSKAWQRVRLPNRRRAYLARRIAAGAKVRLTVRVPGAKRIVRVTV